MCSLIMKIIYKTVTREALIQLIYAQDISTTQHTSLWSVEIRLHIGFLNLI